MPSYPHIERYRDELAQLIEFGGSDSELSIRSAFQNCLAAYCHEHRERLVLVPELAAASGIPDGTVKDALRMARGYWEAKDTHDNLDTEIQRKFDRGYPRDNIIFEDSRTAVLIQNREEVMRADMSRPEELHRLIRSFLDYELPQIEEFRQAQQQFKADLPTVIGNLREAVEEAEADNPEYQTAAAAFLELCKRSIGPAVSAADVREMLLQHILTQDIFLRVFGEDQFHRENDIARRLTELGETFFTGDVRREAIDRLRAYYGAIGRAADEIADYAEKQQFLKAIYEDFYKSYNPAAADRLGVVYTPNEIVDFIIRGADHLLQKHFGRSLGDKNVQILDPATGTGTFVTNLISYLAGSREPDALERLEHKYRHEIHANEVAILPYYIANLNIEYTYKEKTGRSTWSSPTCALWTRWTTWTGRERWGVRWRGRGPSTWVVSPPRTGCGCSSRTRRPSASSSATRRTMPTSRTITTTTGTASTRRLTSASAIPTLPTAGRRRPSSTTCTSGSSAGRRTVWPTTGLSRLSPIGHTLMHGKMTAFVRSRRRSLPTYTFWTWGRTCAAIPKSPGLPTTSLASRPASP